MAVELYLKVERGGFLDDVDVDQICPEPDHFVLDVVDGGAENVLVGLHALLLIPDSYIIIAKLADFVFYNIEQNTNNISGFCFL